MIIHRRLKPGQPGTKKLLEKYGADLVCVRYRYDTERRTRTKTVELIVAESAWEPRGGRIPPNKLVYVRVAYGEIRLGRLVKAAGGRWDRERRLWLLAHREVVSLGLQGRIVAE